MRARKVNLVQQLQRGQIDAPRKQGVAAVTLSTLFASQLTVVQRYKPFRQREIIQPSWLVATVGIH